MRWRGALERKFLEAGFSSRAANVLALHTDIESLEDLATRPWETERGRGLGKLLANAPNCGLKVIGEIKAFRELGDPRRCCEIISSSVTIWLDPPQVAALDAWIAQQARRLSRQAAVRLLMEGILQDTVYQHERLTGPKARHSGHQRGPAPHS
jgi:hypothetical protein